MNQANNSTLATPIATRYENLLSIDRTPDIIKPNGYLFVDTETGGLNAETCALVQIAAIRTDLQFRIKAIFMSYIQPCPLLICDDKALEINHLNREELEKEPEESRVAEAFYDFASAVPNLRFAAYNVPFDDGFIRHWLKRCGINSVPYIFPALDLLVVARKKLKLNNHRLVTVAEHLGFNATNAHCALFDTHVTVKVARKLREIA